MGDATVRSAATDRAVRGDPGVPGNRRCGSRECAVPRGRAHRGPTTNDTDWVLAFQRFAGGNWDIWSRPTRGHAGQQPQFDAAVPLVFGPGNQTAPAYSWVLQGDPLLAYTSDQTGQREIWLRDTAGTLTRLTSDGAGYANPDFAARYRPLDPDADGNTDGWLIGVAFESTRGGGPRAIWALDIELDIDGKYVAVHNLRRVVSGPADLFAPSWQTTRAGEPGTRGQRVQRHHLCDCAGWNDLSRLRGTAVGSRLRDRDSRAGGAVRERLGHLAVCPDRQPRGRLGPRLGSERRSGRVRAYRGRQRRHLGHAGEREEPLAAHGLGGSRGLPELAAWVGILRGSGRGPHSPGAHRSRRRGKR